MSDDMARTTKAEEPKPADPRTETAAVRDYLELLTAAAKPRGRRTVDYMTRRIEQINNTDTSGMTAMDRITLIQERMDLEADLRAATDDSAREAAEKQFIEVGAGWAARKGISYAALREIGVPAPVLKAAGISR